jgi:hypothetical protein
MDGRVSAKAGEPFAVHFHVNGSAGESWQAEARDPDAVVMHVGYRQPRRSSLGAAGVMELVIDPRIEGDHVIDLRRYGPARTLIETRTLTVETRGVARSGRIQQLLPGYARRSKAMANGS